jgi:predicted alpha/beta superfamily hydrolase
MQHIEGTPSFTGIAGYSLAGLFALYATYRCEVFDRVASMSGSLWFPNFRDNILSHQMKKQPEKMYFSLGDKEAKTRNRLLKAVQSNTEEIVKHYEQLGINVTWELNPGNHFRDAALRSAKGIKAILE